MDALKCGRRVELACSQSKLGADTYHTNNSFLESCVYFFRRGPAETTTSKRGKEKDEGATPGAQNVLFQFRDKFHSQGRAKSRLLRNCLSKRVAFLRYLSWALRRICSFCWGRLLNCLGFLKSDCSCSALELEMQGRGSNMAPARAAFRREVGKDGRS